MKSFLIGAATSNSGKTTFTMGLLRALTQRGLCVQPFKCGPDYIDTIFHHMASGNESLNLDTFMASDQHVRKIFSDYSQNADVAIAEGVMGLFDGYDGFFAVSDNRCRRRSQRHKTLDRVGRSALGIRFESFAYRNQSNDHCRRFEIKLVHIPHCGFDATRSIKINHRE